MERTRRTDSLSLQRWANILHLVSDYHIDLCGIQEYDAGFPLPRRQPPLSATTISIIRARHGNPGGRPGQNTLVPHVLEVVYSPQGLAAALRHQLLHGARHTTVCVYSKFIARAKTEVDPFIHSMTPYGIIMGYFKDDIWAASPTHPWQEGLDGTSVLDPVLATPHHPDVGQYFTRIPRHGRPRRWDAILIREQILNIPWTYYIVMRMPVSDHSMVVLGLKWCTRGRVTMHPPPQPTVARWYAPHFKKFTTRMACLGHCDTHTPPTQARLILGAIA